MKNKRLIIYPKDVARITGKSLRHGSDLLQKVRKFRRKKPSQMVTVSEFCEFTGLNLADVDQYLN